MSAIYGFYFAVFVPKMVIPLEKGGVGSGNDIVVHFDLEKAIAINELLQFGERNSLDHSMGCKLLARARNELFNDSYIISADVINRQIDPTN